MFFINSAIASGVEAVQPPSQLPNIFLMIVIFAVFYIFLIRPQSKQMKEHRQKVAALKKGDVVVTAGGIYGKVVKLQDEEIIHVQIAESSIIQVRKATISDVSDKKFSVVKTEVKDTKKPSKKKKA